MSGCRAVVEITESGQKEAPPIKKRETWARQLDFFIACVGCSVGLGNVWRFPFLCYKNGGGAFLIPYFFFVVIAGLPIFVLEIAVGQYTSRGGVQTWNVVPLFQGIGVATTIVLFVFNCYYNVIIGWTIYYIASSVTTQLPWETCGHAWNTLNCSNARIKTTNVTEEYRKAWKEYARSWTDPVTEFWERKVLSISEGIDHPGSVKWDLALCLLLAWVVIYTCVCKGIRVSGKVMYFTATAPYVFMFIILIRNCTLDGAYEGIEYYLKPNLTKLTESMVWVDAGTQIIFSWGVGLGAITMLGSYNKFKHNFLRDAFAFSLVNALTSFIAGFSVFSILGFMAKQQNVLVSDVAESGPGLAFIAYPKAVSQLPLSPLWSLLFFSMLILLGLDSEFVGLETVVTAFVDQFPHFLRKGHRKEVFIGGVCILKFLAGLSMVTEGGMYVFQIFDYYSGGRFVILVALSEIVAMCHCYGINRFIDNIRMMVGNTWLQRVLPFFKIMWVLFTPIFCLVMFVLSIYNYSELSYKRPYHPEYKFPQWAVAIGWTMASVGIIWIPLVAIYRIVRLARMGGRLSNGDFHLLLIPHFLSEHQKRPEDKYERCLAEFEKSHQQNYDTFKTQEQPDTLDIDDAKSVV